MARLNEAPLAADPLETLRRKFLRQNRDIARVNSTQSLRIRSLENEISRLLAENLDFREQILRLRSEATVKNSQAVADHINSTKSQLEVRLQEINALVAGLNKAPKPMAESPVEEQQSDKTAAFRSSEEKKWRNMCAMSEEVAIQEGRLPPILENKTFPRRTLDPIDIANSVPDPEQELLDGVESPEIKPPPVSRFVNEEPIKIELPAGSAADRDDICDINPVLSVNLEQRRKRKGSIGNTEKRRASRFEPQVQQSGPSLRVGAKRKMSVRDGYDENQTLVQSGKTSPDDFKYTKRNVEDQVKMNAAISSTQSKERSAREVASTHMTPLQRRADTISTRKVLGNKSTNVDVQNSPKKSSKDTVNGKPLTRDGPDMKVPKNSSQESRQTSATKKSSAEPAIVTVEVLAESREPKLKPEVEPETPSIPAAGISSPVSSLPSTTRITSRDTPPPSELGSSSDSHRPSRRARASVSYAEPNLRDKMRRPTEQLFDAVTGEGKVQRLSIATQETKVPTTEIEIKGEPVLNESWKDMPSAAAASIYAKSPLATRTTVPEMSMAEEAGHSHRRTSSLNPDGARETPRSGSGSVISALIAGQRKSKQERKNHVKPTDSHIEKVTAKLDVFEFKEPPLSEDSSAVKVIDAGIAKPGKVSRQPTSEPQDSGQVSDDGGLDAETEPACEPTMSRRRRSTLGLANSRSLVNPQVQKIESVLKKPGSSTDSAVPESGNTRSERAAGRRRSMML